LQFIDLIKN